MFRFNEPNRTFAEVPEEIGQYTCEWVPGTKKIVAIILIDP